MLKQLPIGISTFSELIKKNYVYIDKTAIIYQLVTNKKYYFLNRPRRFGKSLLISTLAEIFLGNKELFSGLAINSLPYDWQKYPVIRMSFAGISYKSPETLENGIKIYLQRIAQSYNVTTLHEKLTPGEMLQELIIQLSHEEAIVVLLIDEYDYPILQHIHNKNMAQAIRNVLKSFYDVLKDLDKYLRFVFFTGVSKFSQTSIFSGLNNLQDIGLKPEFNPLLGYTQDEIISYFEAHLINTAHVLQCSIDKLLADIKTWYDGYQFTFAKSATKIYNPFSVLLLLDNSMFSNYWFQTATPTFLINLLQTSQYQMQDFEHMEAVESELGTFDIETIPLKTLLFQTGYLTIHDYNTETKVYLLTYPNKETVDSLADYLFASIMHQSSVLLNKITVSLLHTFENNDLPHLKALLTQFFATIPYNMQLSEEKYYQLAFYIILKMAGATIIAEQQTNTGRIDAVIQTKNHYFIIEMKINASAQAALAQIKKKEYYQPYEWQGKKIILVGIAFDTMKKNVSDIKYREHIPTQQRKERKDPKKKH